MPGEMHWGPFTLQWSMLSWIVAILAGYGLIYIVLKRHKNEQLSNELLSIIGNALFTFIIIWKFGAVISDFSMIWTRPLGLLLFTGGLRETYYGILAAVIVVLYSLRKRKLSIRALADVLSWGVPAGVGVYQIFNLSTDLLNISLCILSVGVLLILLLTKSLDIGSGLAMRRFCISLGLGLLVITLFKQQNEEALLTREQIWFVGMVLIGLLHNSILNFIDFSFIVHPNLRKERDSMVDSAEQENGA